MEKRKGAAGEYHIEVEKTKDKSKKIKEGYLNGRVEKVLSVP